jgi:hypothetical protein
MSENRFIDWLAATLFITDDDVATHQQVADAQAENLERLRREGKVGLLEYWDQRSDIADAGNQLAEFRDQNTGVVSLAATVPAWVWLLAALLVFGWMGGFLWLAKFTKGIMNR